MIGGKGVATWFWRELVPGETNFSVPPDKVCDDGPKSRPPLKAGAALSVLS
jgi:hypothetical protein